MVGRLANQFANWPDWQIGRNIYMYIDCAGQFGALTACVFYCSLGSVNHCIVSTVQAEYRVTAYVSFRESHHLRNE